MPHPLLRSSRGFWLSGDSGHATGRQKRPHAKAQVNKARASRRKLSEHSFSMPAHEERRPRLSHPLSELNSRFEERELDPSPGLKPSTSKTNPRNIPSLWQAFSFVEHCKSGSVDFESALNSQPKQGHLVTKCLL